MVVVLLAAIFWQRYGKRIKQYWAERKPRVKRPFNLRPKSPQDCPTCVEGVTLQGVNLPDSLQLSVRDTLERFENASRQN